MKIKLTLQRSGAPVDLLATVDVSAKVGDLAAHLVRADPTRGIGAGRADGHTLYVAGAEPMVLAAGISVGDSGLRSGMTVVVTSDERPHPAGRIQAAAVIAVVKGPDQGKEFTLPRGSNIIGRDRGCDVRLSDPMVSRQHARINVSDVAEIIDLGSVNGLQLGDAPVSRSLLRAGDLVRLGDTEMLVRVVPPPGAGVDSAVEGFNRSPRLDPVYAGEKFQVPEPPRPNPPTRFPIVPLMTPLLLGAVLYLTTHTLTSLLFVALSPLMMVGYAIESRLANRSAYRLAVAQFRADLAGLVRDLRAELGREVTARAHEHPSTAECVEAIRRGSPLLWTRRPGDPGFAELCLGLGRQPSRSTIEMPTGQGLPRDLMAEVTTATGPLHEVDGVPVVAAPAQHGAIGVAGRREALLAVARALVIQVVALHSPAELVVAGFASRQSAQDWEWLKWLPHTTSPHSPVNQRLLAATIAEGNTLISELEGLLARRTAKEAEPLPAVFVVVEGDTNLERSRLVQLAEAGGAHGIHVLWLAADTVLLPAACRSYVAVDRPSAAGVPAPGAATTGLAGFVHSGTEVEPLALETTDDRTAMELARRLAPLVDTGARADDDSDLPRAASLMTLSEQPLVASADAVIERWTATGSILTGPYAPAVPPRKPGTLRAVLGTSAAGAHVLDLRTDGPHALIGGTTGAGKSELLQSWILALATAYSPDRVTFLLIDYKGGSAFRELDELPHTVGLVTDLDPYLVRRALTSLGAELRHRERLLAENKVKDLVELEKLDPRKAPPSLVIVVDEFAALVKELPDFVDGVINVAQRGRSLGVHLILATQRPAGVINDNLRANTNLRLALRMADEADSLDVLGSKQAAYFDSALPGRAVSKTGPGRLVPFQTGYAGGWTTEEPPPPQIVVEELAFGTGLPWEVEAASGPSEFGPTDIQRLVSSMRSARRLALLGKVRRPWMPALADIYDLGDPEAIEIGRSDAALVFGKSDDPANQAQPTVAFHPDAEGNLAVYGTGGSGKTTLLRTLAIVAGSTVAGAPVHVYGLDFGAQGLAVLEELPHVGSIIPGDDHERVARLLSWLHQLVAERARRYRAADAGTITEYRATRGVTDEPRILLMLDGVAAFRQAYEVGERSRWFEMFCSIATDGRPVGVHVLVTADRPASVPSALASAVQNRVVLRMAEVGEYGMLNLPADVLKASSPPGRGLLGGAEIQVATLGTERDAGSQAANIRDFATTMRAAGVRPAPAIASLAELVPLGSLPPVLDGRPVIGMAAETLSPLAFEPSGTFLVSGAPGAGRSATLHALAVSLRRWSPEARLYYFGSRRSPLAELGLWDGTAGDALEAAELAATLAAEVPGAAPGKPVVALVENVSQFFGTAADLPLTELARACVTEGCLFVAEGETTTVTTGISAGLLTQMKFSRTGLALAPDSNDGQVFRTTFPPRLNRADFPPGRALFVSRGRTQVVQVGLVGEGTAGAGE